MEFRPIGTVANGIIEGRGRDWGQVIPEVRVADHFTGALNGLEEFSHVIILYHCHWARPAVSMTTHPHGQDDLPQVGLFANRSPFRPNPIALTVVGLLERRSNALRVHGLDTLGGTPVLDIKPYIRNSDCFPDAVEPELAHILNEESPE